MKYKDCFFEGESHYLFLRGAIKLNKFRMDSPSKKQSNNVTELLMLELSMIFRKQRYKSTAFGLYAIDLVNWFNQCEGIDRIKLS
nr:MAG TPA: hypothetical protein [Caudoviricetes sp.]